MNSDDAPVLAVDVISRFLKRSTAQSSSTSIASDGFRVSPARDSGLREAQGGQEVRLSGPKARLDIVSPISADPSVLVGSLKDQFSIREIRLFTNHPAHAVEGVDRYWVLQSGQHSEFRLGQAHSKMFAFHKGQHVDLFWGSANLSCAAWLCAGKNANVELLVHSRISSRQWQGMLGCLPADHNWFEVSAGPPEFSLDDRAEPRWVLLHGTLENGEMRLTASGSGRRVLRLRTSFATVSVNLHFQDCEATVPVHMARKLGFTGKGLPNMIDWRLPPAAWQSIPINALDRLGGAEIETDLAGSLFEMYASRSLPVPRGRTVAEYPSDEPGRDDRFDEEEELTRSLYQGELDQFVLRWRLVARAISRASTGNDALRTCRIRDAVRRMTKEAAARPTEWPQYRQRFVQDLLENSWHV